MGFLNLPGLGRVHYHEYGSGSKSLLAFHGYGMTGKQFTVLEQTILKEYRIYSFDLFFHGESALTGWTERQIVAGMPQALVKTYAEEWFKVHGQQRISVMGYSVGAKLALLLVQEFAPQIDEVILMAPDGLPGYKGFWFLSHHPFGKVFFRRMMKSRWLAHFVLKSLKGLGIVDESLFKIAYNEIDTEKKRLDVYYTLNIIKSLQPDMVAIAKLINQYHIKCRLVFGQNDNLFPISGAKPFIELLENAEVHEVAMGHWLVTRQLDEYLLNYQAKQ